jgi:hypothetical protein
MGVFFFRLQAGRELLVFDINLDVFRNIMLIFDSCNSCELFDSKNENKGSSILSAVIFGIGR